MTDKPTPTDAVALARYKVVPAHESMFHRFAVVAGDGKQQLYLGREVECENMARKFAGAFLDGAFYQANITPSTQAAGSVPAPQGETNAQLDTDSNPTAPGQQRDMACSLALGQPVGNGSDQVAGHPSAQGNKLLTVAGRNIRSFLRSATFKSESDREAALNCVDVLWEAARAAESVPARDRDRIREIFMAHGFTVKEGQADLKQYVYDAADALLLAARATAGSVLEDAARESEYRRGYRHGYEQRDAEVRGAMA